MGVFNQFGSEYKKASKGGSLDNLMKTGQGLINKLTGKSSNPSFMYEGQKPETEYTSASTAEYADGSTFGVSAKTSQAIANNFVERSVLSIEDPAFNRFIWWIPIGAEPDGLFATEDNPNSALAYLNRTGETARYERLQEVITLMSNMLTDREYVIQSLSGLQGINENWRKPGAIVELNVTLLDDVKWSTWFIMQSLSYICYDAERQIEVLPENLRRFRSLFFIADVRDLAHTYVFQDDLSDVFQKNSWPEGEINGLYDKQPHKVWYPFIKDNVAQNCILEIANCYFKPNVFPDSIDNTNPEEMKHSLTLICRKFRVSTVFAAHGLTINQWGSALEQSAGKMKDGGSFWSKLKDKAVATVASAAAGYVDAVTDKIQEQAMNKIYELAEKTGIKNAVNKIMNVVYKPGLTVAQLTNSLKRSSNETSYFSNVQIIDSAKSNESEYHQGSFGTAERASQPENQYYNDIRHSK